MYKNLSYYYQSKIGPRVGKMLAEQQTYFSKLAWIIPAEYVKEEMQ